MPIGLSRDIEIDLEAPVSRKDEIGRNQRFMPFARLLHLRNWCDGIRLPPSSLPAYQSMPNASDRDCVTDSFRSIWGLKIQFFRLREKLWCSALIFSGSVESDTAFSRSESVKAYFLDSSRRQLRHLGRRTRHAVANNGTPRGGHWPAPTQNLRDPSSVAVDKSPLLDVRRARKVCVVAHQGNRLNPVLRWHFNEVRFCAISQLVIVQMVVAPSLGFGSLSDE